MGYKTTATGDNSTAIGESTTATGDFSTAMGVNTRATGDFSTAMGDSTTAVSYGQTTIGIYNTVVPSGDKSFFEANDRLFVIGNGKDQYTPSNALEILKNGNTTLNWALTIRDPNDTSGKSSYTLPTKKGTADQVLTITNSTTGTTTWTTLGVGHLQQVEEGKNTGYRILGRDPNFYGAIGENALDLSYQELLPNLPNKIKRETSTVKGSPSTGATGTNSTAIGVGTTASGNTSTAMGNGTNATGYFSTAMGDYTTAESYGQTTIGMNNTTLAGSTTVFDANDRLFVIGNGESVTKESDALVILENGDTRLNGALTVSGTISTPGTVHHPDYVFERYYEEVSEYNKSYSLPSLSEIEVFVKANKHLPGVQSRSDIKEKGSWNITENVRTNLEKVEELYLHAIAQEKKIDAQSKVIEQLILRLDALEKKE